MCTSFDIGVLYISLKLSALLETSVHILNVSITLDIYINVPVFQLNESYKLATRIDKSCKYACIPNI